MTQVSSMRNPVNATPISLKIFSTLRKHVNELLLVRLMHSNRRSLFGLK